MQDLAKASAVVVAAHSARNTAFIGEPGDVDRRSSGAGPATPALVVAFELSEKGAFLSAESVSMMHQPRKPGLKLQ